MKTQIELINYYTKHLEKVITVYGLNSDYTNNAFFLLQAVKLNIPQENIFDWANNECEKLKNVKSIQDLQKEAFEAARKQNRTFDYETSYKYSTFEDYIKHTINLFK
jgi:hypothetical protein